MKTILIAGSSGLIGHALKEMYSDRQLFLPSRDDFSKSDEEFVDSYKSAEIIINVTGSAIIGRWTQKKRKAIIESRINTTRKLGRLMENTSKCGRHLINSSAIGIYPDKGEHTENSQKRGNGFLKELVEKWENEAKKYAAEGNIITILRTGIVLSKEGGMIKKLLPLYRAGFGGRISNGKQHFSWIHLKDLVRVIDFVINKEAKGIFNAVSPVYCSNKEFSDTLAIVTGKPAFLMIPGIVLRLIYGQSSDIIKGGQAVIPERLIKEGFSFEYTDLKAALEEIVE